MFSKIKSRTIKLYNFFKSHKKQATLFGFLFIFGLGAYLTLGIQPAQAADFFSTETIVKAFATILLSAASLMIRLAIFCLSFIIEIAGYNGYLTSTAVQVGWVMVRDITNMFFVVILLLVAFGTILGLEQYEWKKMLVKFFFAAILVNFSRIICGLIIDISQVVMITFVNGIAATAGGNLITALSLDKIYSVNPQTGPTELTNPSEIFGAAVGALAFAALTLGIMAVYVFILLARLLMLWILIVLSPFAFVFSVIPQTEKYASQWWSEFGNHVIVGPVVVFFLWLSFAIVGGGEINKEIEANNSAPESSMPSKGANGTAATVGISAVMSFEKIANFAIAIGILLVGAKTAQSLGTVGGSAMGKATDFAKKAVMLGSGAAAGMWAVGKAKDLGGKAVSGLKTAAWNVTPIGDWAERMQNFAKRQVDSWKIYRAEGPKLKTEEYIDDKTGERRQRFVKKKEEYVDEKTGEVKQREIEGEYEYEEEDSRSWFQKTRYASREKILKSRKLLEKTTNQAKLRDELIDKRITAIPAGLFLRDMPDGFDRIEQGMLAAEKERSEAKTKEYQEYGRRAALEAPRFKDGRFQREKDSMAEQIVGHRERAERNVERTKALMSGVLEQYRKGKEGTSVVAAKVEAKFKAEIAEKAAHLTEGGAKLHFMERAGALLTKQAKIAAEEAEEHAKVESLEKRAAATFSDTDSGKHMLEAQAKAELESDTAKTQMSNNLTKAKHHFDEEAIKAELEAQKIMEGVSGIHSEAATGKLAQRKARQEEVSRLQSTKQGLQGAIDSATTPEELAQAKKALSSFEATGSIKRIEDQIETLDKEILDLDNNDEKVKKTREDAKNEARKKRASSISWSNSAAHAKETEEKNAFSRDHNYLLGEVEQEEIFKPRGITVPNEALSEAREYYRKRFVDMDYDTYTSSMGTNILAMIQKNEDAATLSALKKKGQDAAENKGPKLTDEEKFTMDSMIKDGRGVGPTAADKSMMAAMLDHGVAKSWLDDGIWRAMAPDLQAKMKAKLGWKGKEFNVEKINDLFAILSTGGDMEFASMHKQVSKVMDFAVQKMGMGVAQFYDKLENQSFSASELSSIKTQFGEGSDQFKTITDKSKMSSYIKTQDDNQAQLQFVTNLRDQMAEGSHTENGGHAVNIKSSSGKQRHVFVSGSIAQDNVLGEVNKDTVANRAKKQSHSYLNLDEGTGYATRTRAKAYRISRGDVNNHLSHSGTNQRYLNHIAGLSPTENAEDYFSEKDGLMITGTKSNGADSGRHTWAQSFSDDGIELKDRYDKIKQIYAQGGKWNGITKAEDALHQQTTNDWFNELVKDQLFTNPQDVLMSLAKKSQIDPQDAYLTGKMNISVMVNGKKQKINNITELINYYNAGAFSGDGTPPQRKMAQFKKASKAGQNATRNDPNG